MSENYISQFYTWATGNTITAPRLNGNVSNVTDGLSSGVKAVNIGKLLIGGTETINGSRNGIFNGITLSSDITTISYAIDWDLIDNTASALSFDATGKTGLLEFDTTDGAEGLKSSGFLRLGSDASALTDVGAFVLGASNDSGLFFNGTDLVIQTDGAGASGIIFDSEDDTFEFKGSGTLQATFDTTGLNLVSGDVFKINGTSVLSNDTLGSGVVNTSITSTGALNSGSITSGFGNIDVGSSNIDGGTITADTALVGTLSTASQTNITSVGTLTSLTVSGDATFDTSTLKVDSTNDRVGIGLSSPSHRLDVDDSSLNSGNVGTVARIKSSGTSSTAVTVLNVQDNVYVDGGGSLLINRSSSVNSSYDFQIGQGNSSSVIYMESNSSGVLIEGVDSVGNSSNGFKIGHITSTGRLQMRCGSSGGVELFAGNTSWSSLSDERAKDIIEPISNALYKVNKLRSVIGKYKADDEGIRRSFLIAQDVKQVLPEAVEKTNFEIDGDEYLALTYDAIIPLLVASVKEITKELDALKNK
jgi:hypothetical protein